MFNKKTNERISEWVKHRNSLENSETPLDDVWEFWKAAPFIPYNKKIDPYNKKTWPTPWEIIDQNKYDDFTKSLMIAISLKYTNKFKNTPIEISIIVDNNKTKRYNIVIVDGKHVINFDDNGPISRDSIDDSHIIENLIQI
jgi:hypothetical protein